MSTAGLNDSRSFVELRNDLTEALLAVTLQSGVLFDELRQIRRTDERMKEILEASLEASAILAIMFQEDTKNFCLATLQTAFSIVPCKDSIAGLTSVRSYRKS